MQYQNSVQELIVVSFRDRKEYQIKERNWRLFYVSVRRFIRQKADRLHVAMYGPRLCTPK